MKKVILFAGVALLCGSCTVQRELLVSGGSKADGTVTLVTESYNMGKKVIIDREKGLEKAKDKCQQWGYKNAEYFDVGIRESIPNSYNVITVIKVQCTD